MVTESSGFPSHYWGYVDKTGKLVIPMKFLGADNFNEGLAVVRIEVNNQELCGYINKSGAFVINPQYLPADQFCEGLAAVALRSTSESDSWKTNTSYNWSYISKEGHISISQKFWHAGRFSEGLAAIRTTSPATGEATTGYIDHKGKLVIKVKGTKAKQFHDGVALVESGLINKFGNLVLPYKVKINNSMIVQISEQHRYVMTTINDSYQDAPIISEDLIPIINLVTHRCGYMNIEGKIIIPPSYLYAFPFSDGLGCVQLKLMQVYVDKSGKMVIKPQFRTAGQFSEGLAAVAIAVKKGKTSQFGYIDKLGKWVIKPKYDSAADFHEGMAAVRIGDKWGFIDRTGKMIVQPKYDIAASFSEGRAAVAVKF
ncbi:MAG: WG repeat-containing protein [Armatimonadota bacterium]